MNTCRRFSRSAESSHESKARFTALASGRMPGDSTNDGPSTCQLNAECCITPRSSEATTLVGSPTERSWPTTSNSGT